MVNNKKTACNGTPNTVENILSRAEIELGLLGQ